jgi:hypothetical protein
MTESVVARFGFFPLVTADRVTISQANTSVALAKGDLDVRRGGGSLLAAGGNARVTQGGAMAIAAGGNVTIEEGGAVVLAARSVDVSNGFVGLALGRSVTVRDSRILLGTAQAAALGAALGAVVVLGRLLARR